MRQSRSSLQLKPTGEVGIKIFSKFFKNGSYLSNTCLSNEKLNRNKVYQDEANRLRDLKVDVNLIYNEKLQNLGISRNQEHIQCNSRNIERLSRGIGDVRRELHSISKDILELTRKNPNNMQKVMDNLIVKKIAAFDPTGITPMFYEIGKAHLLDLKYRIHNSNVDMVAIKYFDEKES